MSQTIQTTSQDGDRYTQLRYRIAGIIEPALTQAMALSEPFHERSARMAAEQLAQFKADQILSAVRAAGVFPSPPPPSPASPAP